MMTSLLIQVPLPTGEVWIQFPVVAVIVVCFILASTGLFVLAKWIWAQYKESRDKDLTWRETQDAKREAASSEQNRLWRVALVERDSRWENADASRQAAMKDLAGMMSHMIVMLAEHDQQAKNIMVKTDAVLISQEIIREQTRRRSAKDLLE